MIRIFLAIAILLTTSQTIYAATKKPTQRELYIADQARHRAQRSAPQKVEFDGVYYWNEAGECVGMKTRCKPCRIGR